MVGFKEEQTAIMKFLLEEKTELDVYSIIGMSGLGKTTLAGKVFQDKTVQYNFPYQIWVYVSQNFNRRSVLLKILQHFKNEDMSHKNDDDLTQIVRDCLQKEKFLLVMDDIWSVRDWDAIELFLPKETKNGKVLITSRDLSVGYHACRLNREPHKLRFLTEHESLNLLHYEAFGNLDNSCPPDLQGTDKSHE